MSGRKCVHCGLDDGDNIRTCQKGCTEIKLFGVQIGVSTDDGDGGDRSAAAGSSSIRKSKSMGHLDECIRENAVTAADESGYLTDGLHYSKSHDKKRGKPWSEEEHRSFLEGLNKLGKGDWKGISSKFVPSRKSSQVASHAQKYFNRVNMTAANKKRRRASVFDISPTHNQNQPLQGFQSNNVDIASSSSAAPAKNVGELKVMPSIPNHVVTTSERPPLSPVRRSGIPELRGVIYQPRVSSFTKGYQTQAVMPSISWVPVVNYSDQNGVFVPNIHGNYAAVVPHHHPSLDTWRQGWFQPPSTTNNDELNLHIRNLRL
ncbi:hypothetical protein C2S52_003261 [Perilla frutescens var. hirtella]|nr:hypothetical protein C2S52_003261 [Perilla frutescens var. hirtella]